MSARLVIGCLTLLLVLPRLASAQSTDAACEPVVQDSARFGSLTVYRECAVARKAKLRKDVNPEFVRDDGTLACVVAEIEAVIDARGRVVKETARVLDTNAKAFGSALLGVLDEWRFEPAERDGEKVAQLVRFEHAQRVTNSRGGTAYSVQAMGSAGGPLRGRPGKGCAPG